MTPLSRALLQIKSGRPSSSAVASPFIDAEGLAPPTILPMASGVERTAKAALPIKPSPANDSLTKPSLPKPKGVVRLACDLTAEGLAMEAGRPFEADRWIFLSASSREKTESDTAPREGDWPIRWPQDAHVCEVASNGDCPTTGPTVQLAFASPKVEPREGVLFLDACRRAFASTAIVVDASQEQLAQWLAERCDEIWLIAQSGVTEVEDAKAAANRLAQAARARPNCVLMPAA